MGFLVFSCFDASTTGATSANVKASALMTPSAGRLVPLLSMMTFMLLFKRRGIMKFMEEDVAKDESKRKQAVVRLRRAAVSSSFSLVPTYLRK